MRPVLFTFGLICLAAALAGCGHLRHSHHRHPHRDGAEIRVGIPPVGVDVQVGESHSVPPGHTFDPPGRAVGHRRH